MRGARREGVLPRGGMGHELELPVSGSIVCVAGDGAVAIAGLGARNMHYRLGGELLPSAGRRLLLFRTGIIRSGSPRSVGCFRSVASLQLSRAASRGSRRIGRQ